MMDMLAFALGAIIFLAWFWLSLHPGSRLGFALTPGDLTRAFRQLDRKELQTRGMLRAAGRKSSAFWSLLTAVGVAAGIADGNYTLRDAVLGFPGGVVAGMGLGYALLHWSTRDGGWYGVD
jgi:hypothetical protein